MAPVTILFKDKVASPKLRSGDFVVGAFGKEIGMLRKGAYGWYWLERPSELFPCRPDAIDSHILTLISQGSLTNDLEFSIAKRQRVTPALKALVRQRDSEHCQYCLVEGRRMPGKVYDHFIPVAFGGAFTPDNVILVCSACNREKWHIPPWHFFGEKLKNWAPGKPRPEV